MAPTKQERIIRSMFDQISEHLHEFKALIANPATKETDVERWVQSVLRACLGFSATNGYSIRSQETKGKMRPDLVIYKGEKAICVVEVKKLGYDLNKSDFRSGKVQLAEYLRSVGDVPWGILCNGYEWKLFDFSDVDVGGVEVVCFDLRDDNEEIDTGKRATEDICWDFLELHEFSFASGVWKESAKEATAFSPESLAKALLSVDVVRHVARHIRGEHEFKVNAEVLVDKIFNLLTMGLDDAVTGWGEAKQIEIHKYVKSQKRANRRRSSKSKENKQASNDAPESASTSPDVQEDPNKKVA